MGKIADIAKNKGVLLLLAVVTVVASIVVLERKPDTTVACAQGESESVHAVVVSDEEGACRALGEFVAPLTIINVWASWCPYCVEEMPALSKVADEYPHIPVVAVNRAETRATADAFLDTLSISDNVHIRYDATDDVYKAIGGFGMPETVFVNSMGEILFHKRGIMSLEELRDIITSLTEQHTTDMPSFNPRLCVEGSACSLPNSGS